MNSNKKNSLRVLIVDGEDITSILRKDLENGGYEVITFNDPLQALSNFKSELYDIVLLDIRMPKMDGFELYQELVKIDTKIRVCFMTAFEVYFDALKELFPSKSLPGKCGSRCLGPPDP